MLATMSLVGNAGASTNCLAVPGDDVYHVDQASGEVTELAGQGIDSAFAFFSHTLAANVENLSLLGTSDINGTGNSVANIIVGNAGNNFLNGAAGADSCKAGTATTPMSSITPATWSSRPACRGRHGQTSVSYPLAARDRRSRR